MATKAKQLGKAIRALEKIGPHLDRADISEKEILRDFLEMRKVVFAHLAEDIDRTRFVKMIEMAEGRSSMRERADAAKMILGELKEKILDLRSQNGETLREEDFMNDQSRLKHADAQSSEETELQALAEARAAEEKAALETARYTKIEDGLKEGEAEQLAAQVNKDTGRKRAYQEYLEELGVKTDEVTPEIIKNTGAGFIDFLTERNKKDKKARSEGAEKLDTLLDFIEENTSIRERFGVQTDIWKKRIEDDSFDYRLIEPGLVNFEKILHKARANAEPVPVAPKELPVAEELPPLVNATVPEAASSGEKLDVKNAAAAYRMVIDWSKFAIELIEKFKNSNADRIVDDATRLMNAIEKYAPQYHKTFLNYQVELSRAGLHGSRETMDEQRKIHERVLYQLAADVTDIQSNLAEKFQKAGLKAEEYYPPAAAVETAPESKTSKREQEQWAIEASLRQLRIEFNNLLIRDKDFTVLDNGEAAVDKTRAILITLRERLPDFEKIKVEIKRNGETEYTPLKSNPNYEATLKINIEEAGTAAEVLEAVLREYEAENGTSVVSYEAPIEGEIVNTPESEKEEPEIINVETESVDAERQLILARTEYQVLHKQLGAELGYLWELGKDPVKEMRAIEIRVLAHGNDPLQVAEEYGMSKWHGELIAKTMAARRQYYDARRAFGAALANEGKSNEEIFQQIVVAELEALQAKETATWPPEKKKVLQKVFGVYNKIPKTVRVGIVALAATGAAYGGAALTGGFSSSAQAAAFLGGKFAWRWARGLASMGIGIGVGAFTAKKLAAKREKEFTQDVGALRENYLDNLENADRRMLQILQEKANAEKLHALYAVLAAGGAAMIAGGAGKLIEDLASGSFHEATVTNIVRPKPTNIISPKPLDIKFTPGQPIESSAELDEPDLQAYQPPDYLVPKPGIGKPEIPDAGPELREPDLEAYEADGVTPKRPETVAGDAALDEPDLQAYEADGITPKKPEIIEEAGEPDEPDLKAYDAEGKPLPREGVEDVPEKPEQNFFEQATKERDSVWKMAEDQMHKHYGAKFDNLNSAQKTYILDTIKVRLGPEAKDIIPEGYKMDFSKVIGNTEDVEKLIKRAEGLSQETLARIDANNKAITDWLKAHPHEQLTEAKANAAIESRFGRAQSSGPTAEGVDTSTMPFEKEPSYLTTTPEAIPSKTEVPPGGEPSYLTTTPEAAPAAQPETPPGPEPDYLSTTPEGEPSSGTRFKPPRDWGAEPGETPPGEEPDYLTTTPGKVEGPFPMEKLGIEALAQTRIPSPLQKIMLTPWTREFSSIQSVSVKEFLTQTPTPEDLARHPDIENAIRAGEYKVGMRVGPVTKIAKVTMNHVKLHAALDRLNLSDDVQKMDIFSFARRLHG